MKIERITMYHVSIELKKPFIVSFGTIKERESILIKVESNGLIGWGESPFLQEPIYNHECIPGGKAIIKDILVPRIIGKEVSSPEETANIFSDIVGNNMAKSGIEAAIWDLFAKKSGKPLWEYLKGSEEALVGASIGISDKETSLAKVQEAVDKGMKRIKIKIRPGHDVDIIKSIRESFPSIPLMVDGNAGYTLEDEKVFTELDAYNLIMIEQPLANDDIIDHAALQKKIKTAICLDESVETMEDAKKAIQIDAAKIINIKMPRVGGIAETKKILSLCVSKGIGAWIGGMLETSIGKTLNAHLARLKGITFPSDLTMPSTYLVDDIAIEPAISNGRIILGKEAGIGIVVDEEKIEKYLISKKVFEEES